MKNIELQVLPRETMDWETFLKVPAPAIALDGVVTGGPNESVETKHVNLDHHDNVVRQATMSTSMQAMYRIKENLMKYFSNDGKQKIQVYVNDTDQDVALAVWLLDNYKLFQGTRTIPSINRLLDITDKLDITGGSYPLDLDDAVMRQQNWVFEPYNELRKSGKLAEANVPMMKDNLAATYARITALMMGQADEKALDTRHEILFQNGLFWIVDEIGGTEARYYLFTQGMDAFISKIATREDGRSVYTVGKRTPYAPVHIPDLYDVFNQAEGLTRENGWNGSNNVGGSSREYGSKLLWQELAGLTMDYCKGKLKAPH